MVVRTKKIQCWIEKTSLLQTDEHRVRPVQRSQTTITETSSRLPVQLLSFGNTDLVRKPSTPFEDAQNVSRLTVFESRQWIEKRQNSLFFHFFWGWSRNGLKPLWRAIHGIAFTVFWPLVRNSSVVIERRSPQHAAVGHHAFLDFKRLARMATGVSATQMSDSQIAWIYEPNKLRTLFV